MEGSLEDDDRRASSGSAGDLDRVLDCLGAGVQQNRLLVGTPARGDLRQSAAHLEVGLVGADDEALVQVQVDLSVDRRDDRGVAMPEVLRADPAGEVDELAPLRVPDQRAARVRDGERRRRDAAGDVPPPRLGDLLELASFLQSHEAAI